MQNLSPEEAIDWVDQNTKQIIGHAKKYLPFAPYDRDDFLQDAYEAALEASGVSNERQISFPACFWIVFKGKISDVTPNPDSKRNGGSHSPPSNFCDWSDFSMESAVPNDILDLPESLSVIDIDRVYPLIRQHLTRAENRILEVLFGIHDGPMKIREAARHLGCSPPNVRQALNRACSRMTSLVGNGELNIQVIDDELVDLQHIWEDNRSRQPEDHQAIAAENPCGDKINLVEPRQSQPDYQQRKPSIHRIHGAKSDWATNSNKNDMASKYTLPDLINTGFSQIGVPNNLVSLKKISAKADFAFVQPKLGTDWTKGVGANTTFFVADKMNLTGPDIENCRSMYNETSTSFAEIKRQKLCLIPTASRHCRDGPFCFHSGRPPNGDPVTYDYTLLAAMVFHPVFSRVPGGSR